MTTTLSALARTTDVRLLVTTNAAGAAKIEVLRTMMGRTDAVRAWPAITTDWAHADIDVSFNTDITYVARVYNASNVLLETSNTVSRVKVANPSAVIRNALVPAQRAVLRMVGKEAGDSSSDVRREILRPLGRSNPVAITDVRMGSTGTATFLTLDKAEQGQIERLLDSGQILLFTGPVDFGLSWPFYFSAGAVKVSRVSAAMSDARLWSLDWVEVDGPPVTAPTPAVRWQDLKAANKKWRDIRLTPWIDVLYPPTEPVLRTMGSP